MAPVTARAPVLELIVVELLRVTVVRPVTPDRSVTSAVVPFTFKVPD